MTIDEAISIMNVIVHMMEPQYDTDRIEEAVEMAIKALKQQVTDAVDRVTIKEYLESFGNVKTEHESCEDCVSRSAVLEITAETGALETQARVKALPPVTPMPKMGRWIPLEYHGYTNGNPIWVKWKCSKCGWEHSGSEKNLTVFCPNCGRKMQEVNG